MGDGILRISDLSLMIVFFYFSIEASFGRQKFQCFFSVFFSELHTLLQANK